MKLQNDPVFHVFFGSKWWKIKSVGVSIGLTITTIAAMNIVVFNAYSGQYFFFWFN